ncbi:MAG: DUF87 domain-containing protein [Methanothrix sp.]
MKNIIPVRSLAMKIPFFEPSEPQNLSEEFGEAVYIGKTYKYREPIFYIQKNLINPHIAILGTSGSGKTNLMLNLIMKFSSINGKYIVIVDWSGEYAAIARVLAMSEFDPKIGLLKSHGTYLNLSKFEPEVKLQNATLLLSQLLDCMGSIGTMDMSIFVDEIWHLLQYSETKPQISRIFREGRKYGIGIIAATQLLGDVNNEIIYNAGTIFLFKIYGTDNLNSLKSSMLLDENELSMLPGLDRGSCYCIMLSLGGQLQKAIIKHIQKFEIGFCNLRCSSMEYTITKRSIVEAAEHIFGKEISSKLDFLIESELRSISIEKIIYTLMANGCTREKIIYFMRRLGIKDIIIASAIKYALQKSSE